jgi:hypothetical protein
MNKVKGNKIKRFCHDCGSELVMHSDVVGHDSETGKEKYKYTYECPKNKWYNTHEICVYDEEGNLRSASWWDI